MSTAAFSSDGDEAMKEHSHLDTLRAFNQLPLPNDELTQVYETDHCVDWINRNGFKTVAIQMPDDLLKDAAPLANIVRTQVEAEVVVMADTSYGSCCVDEVAAEHYSCDAIIHLGSSCLSPTSRLPVLYIFRQLPLDVTDCCEKCSALLDVESKILVVYDVAYHYLIEQIVSMMSKVFQNMVVATVDMDRAVGKCSRIFGRSFELPDDQSVEDFAVLYIGEESLFLTNCIYTWNCCKFYTYSPASQIARPESVNVNKLLMKRYYMVEKTKDARIIGILVGTLGVANYLQVIARLKSLIEAAGKKSYTFVVGKLNVAKLANFAEVEAFVLVACPENTLLDSAEFYQPVVTPFELEMACNPDRQWTGDYVTDFQDLLPGGAYHMELPDGPQEYSTDVSLISGKIRSMGLDDAEDESSGALLKRDDVMIVANTAGAFLAERSWQGLEPQLGETPVQKAVEGSKGIAMGYSHEAES